ncbi:hypothetical protein BX666DRAFT_1983393 [Dichotomocladium elegans]|nr:hypothetical protein BX666DRAFT_1983393 [Dichotomocladium elegans]
MVKISLLAYTVCAMAMLSSVAMAKPESKPGEGYKKTCYCVNNIYSSSSCCSKYHSNGQLNKSGSRCILKSPEQKELYTSCCDSLANIRPKHKSQGLFSFDFDEDEEQEQLSEKFKKTHSCY